MAIAAFAHHEATLSWVPNLGAGGPTYPFSAERWLVSLGLCRAM